MIGWMLMLAGTLIVAVAANRAAYRVGVLDGWRACESPHDPLWRGKLGPLIDKRQPGAWDEAMARENLTRGLIFAGGEFRRSRRAPQPFSPRDA